MAISPCTISMEDVMSDFVIVDRKEMSFCDNKQNDQYFLSNLIEENQAIADRVFSFLDEQEVIRIYTLSQKIFSRGLHSNRFISFSFCDHIILQMESSSNSQEVINSLNNIKYVISVIKKGITIDLENNIFILKRNFLYLLSLSIFIDRLRMIRQFSSDPFAVKMIEAASEYVFYKQRYKNLLFEADKNVMERHRVEKLKIAWEGLKNQSLLFAEKDQDFLSFAFCDMLPEGYLRDETFKNLAAILWRNGKYNLSIKAKDSIMCNSIKRSCSAELKLQETEARYLYQQNLNFRDSLSIIEEHRLSEQESNSLLSIALKHTEKMEFELAINVAKSIPKKGCQNDCYEKIAGALVNLEKYREAVDVALMISDPYKQICFLEDLYSYQEDKEERIGNCIIS